MTQYSGTRVNMKTGWTGHPAIRGRVCRPMECVVCPIASLSTYHETVSARK